MLPKIPYSMEKNKSATVPIGNYNISSNFNPGDIADSYGISARKFPRLTNNKGKELMHSGGGILAMTVFNGEIVTVRATSDGNAEIYAGEDRVCSLSGNHERKLAVINTKLVVFPDKVYIEKVEDEWAIAELEYSIEAKDVNIQGDCLNFTNSMPSMSLSGYGGSLLGNEFSIPITNGHTYLGRYIISYCGGAATVSRVGDALGYGKISKVSGTNRFCIFSYDIEGSVPDEFDKIYVVIDDEAYRGINVEIKLNKENNGYTELSVYADICGYEPVSTEDVSCTIYLADENPDWAFGINPHLNAEVRGSLSVILAGQLKTVDDFELTFEASSFKQNTLIEDRMEVIYKGWDNRGLRDILPGDLIEFEDHPGEFFTVMSEMPDFDEEFVTSVTITFQEDAQFLIDVGADKSIAIKRYRPNADISAMILQFKKGDAVTISGCRAEKNNITFVIARITGGSIHASTEIFETVSEDTITIERKVPDLDFICERDNRIYGINNTEKTVYVSALGDPTNMYAYEGVATDSYAVAVGGEGDFTGCCKYGESVLFFKEDKIYKLTGYTPADFAIDSYDVDGLERGSEKSLVVINEVLYYKGVNGIFAYMGGIPQSISDNFGEDIHLYFNAVAGTDGVNYYIALGNDDDMTRLFCFYTRLKLWVLEEKTGETIDGFVRIGSSLYVSENGDIYRMNAHEDASGREWMVQFVPFYETIEGKKTYSRLLMRAELPRGSYMIIEVRSDDGLWREAGKLVGRNNGIIPIRLPIARCDKFELRLRGKGEFAIHDILREYHVGSEV